MLETKSIILTRAQDFRPFSEEKLPGVSSLLEGLARQSEVDSLNNSDGEAEEVLIRAFHAFAANLPADNFRNRGSRRQLQRSLRVDVRLPRSFKEAIIYPAWREAIDREYKALRDRNTWRYVNRSADMNPFPFTWVFRLKPLDIEGLEFLHKARCCIRGDKQQPHIDFDPHSTYTPVASHEAIRLLLAYAAGEQHIIEGADIGNAYLYGDLNLPIIMAQPTDSSGKRHFLEWFVSCSSQSRVSSKPVSSGVRFSVQRSYLGGSNCQTLTKEYSCFVTGTSL